MAISKARKETLEKSRLWKKQVREQWDNKCCMCGKDGNEHPLDMHHLTYRKELKYQPIIGLALCKSCHKLSHGSAHKESILFYHNFEKKYPELYKEVLELIKYIENSS